MKKHFSKWVPRLFYLFEMLASNEPLPFRWKKAGSFIPAVPSPENIWTEHEADLAPHVAPEIAKHMKEGNFNVYRINYVAADEKYLKEKVNLEPWLESVKTYLSKHGAQLNVCYIPGRSQVTSFYYQYELHNCRKLCPPNMDLTGETYQVHRRDLDTLCRKIGIPFIDLTPTIKKEEDAGNRLFWSYDDHLRDVGYRLVGKTIYQHWTQQ